MQNSKPTIITNRQLKVIILLNERKSKNGRLFQRISQKKSSGSFLLNFSLYPLQII